MTDQPTLRDRIRRAICEADGFEFDDDGLEPDEYGDHADAVMAVLPDAQRAATYQAAWQGARHRARVLSDELTRRAPLNGEYAAAASEAEARRLALSQALGLGTGAPWDAIQERAEELHLASVAEAQPAEAVLPAPVDRAEVLREAADAVRRKAVHDGEDFCNGIDFAADEFRRMADEAQQPEGAWPSESQWRVEMYDPGAGQWMPAGTLTTKAEAERRMALAAERAPRWRDDGTDVRRRIVRTTVTYTVELGEAQR